MLLALFLALAPHFLLSYSRPDCQSFHTTFSSGSIESDGFTSLEARDSYSTGADGLELYLRRPEGKITTKNGVNNKIAEGATLNSTFVFGAGKASFYITAPEVAGVVTAVIMVSEDDSDDEIDVELLGGDPDHWQTNMFAPPKTQSRAKPEYKTFSSKEHVDDIGGTHVYAIDWNETRIQWSLDGKVVRTLKKEDTLRNGMYTYPTHSMRLQLGIWDASEAEGTAAWARGPIDWDSAPDTITAVIHRVDLECGIQPGRWARET